MALDGIVMSERHADGRRFVSSYSGVRRGASGGVELERYVTFDAATRTWTLDHEPPFIAEGLRSGTLTQEEVDEWRSLCPSSRGFDRAFCRGGVRGGASCAARAAGGAGQPYA